MDLHALVTGLLESPAVRLAVLLVARLLPVIALSPLFGGAALPRRLRLVLVVVCAVVLLPGAGTALEAVERRGYVLCLGAEVAYGLVSAILITAVVEVVGAAGALVDLARDASIATVLDPVTHREQSTVGALWSNWFLAAFFAGDGHLALIRAWSRDLARRPPGTPFFGDGGFDAAAVIDTLAAALAASLAAAAPLLVLLLIGKFAVAVVERLAKPMHSLVMLAPLAGLAGVLLVSAGLGEGLFSAITRWVLELAGG